MKRALVVVGLLFAGLLLVSVLAGRTAAQTDKAMYMICPTVSLKNPNGMWVIGGHGAYFVMMHTDPQTGQFQMVSVPQRVNDQAQIASAWGLYHGIASYPAFQGMAMLMGTGLARWIPTGTPGIAADHMVQVTINSNGTSTLKDMETGSSVTIQGMIPLGSAVFWAG